MLAVLVALATALVGMTPAGAASSPKGSEIVVGSIETVTGAPGATGKVTTATDTLNAWAKWENAKGGIAGHPVKVIVMDDKADPAQASSDLKQLVESDHAVAIVGNDASTTEPTWKNYVEAQRVPVIGGTEYSANWFTSPMYYPVSETVISTLWGQVDAAVVNGKRKYASLLCSNSTVCQGAASLIKTSADQLGVDIVYNQLADANATSYTPQCLAMKQSGANVMGPQGVNNVTLLRDCARQNYKPLVITTNYQYTLDQIKATPQFNGLTGPTPSISPYNSYSVTKDRDAAIKKYAPAYAPGGKKYNSVGLMPLTDSWEAGLAFEKAIENSGVSADATVTTKDVIAGLAKFNGETLGGSNPALTYSDGTRPNPQVKCHYLYTIKGDKYVDTLEGKLPKQFCQP